QVVIEPVAADVAVVEHWPFGFVVPELRNDQAEGVALPLDEVLERNVEVAHDLDPDLVRIEPMLVVLAVARPPVRIARELDVSSFANGRDLVRTGIGFDLPVVFRYPAIAELMEVPRHYSN